MNNQEFFTITVNHLRKQGQATNARGTCVYRNSEGKSCAIGVHIPNKMYKFDMEGKQVMELLDDYAEVRTLFEGVAESLMQEMQSLHDYGAGVVAPDYWEQRFKEVAARYQLQVPPCT